MFLKPIEQNRWTFYAFCKDDHSCPLLDFLNALDSRYKGDLSGLVARIEKACQDQHGPRLLPKEISHQIDKKNKIYQITAGKLRLLWFYSERERSVVVCSHAFIKSTRKTPSKHVNKAIKTRDDYFSDYNADRIFIIKDDEEDT